MMQQSTLVIMTMQHSNCGSKGTAMMRTQWWYNEDMTTAWQHDWDGVAAMALRWQCDNSNDMAMRSWWWWYNDKVTMTRYSDCSSKDMAMMQWWNGDCSSKDMATLMVTMTTKTQWCGDDNAAWWLQWQRHNGNGTATTVVMMHWHGENNVTIVTMRTWQQWYDKVLQQGDNGNNDAMVTMAQHSNCSSKGHSNQQGCNGDSAVVTMWCQGDGIDNEKRLPQLSMMATAVHNGNGSV